MRDFKGRFVKGHSNGYEKNLEKGRGWNKDKKGWTNNGSFSKGHEVSDITKIAVSKRHKGNTYRRGQRHTEESNRKNRIAHLGKSTISGENHWNWKGGITPLRTKLYFSKEYVLWRTSVFMRDDYTCQLCNIKGGSLQADHIKPWALYPELRFAIDNGRTLCEPCHRQTDTWGVRKRQNI